MENQFANYIKEHPFYNFYPFVQFYNPKMYQTLSVSQHLEESTLQQPQTPENGALKAVQPAQALEVRPEVDLVSEEEHKTNKRAKKVIKENRRKMVEEYRPYERQNKKRTNCLKENRNVLPIKIRQMLSFLAREKKSQEIIKRYIEKGGFSFNFNEKRFYAFLKMKKEKVGNYVTLSILKDFLGVEPDKIELYSISEQTFFLKVVRVLFKYYLDSNSLLCSLTSNRIQS